MASSVISPSLILCAYTGLVLLRGPDPAFILSRSLSAVACCIHPQRVSLVSIDPWACTIYIWSALFLGSAAQNSSQYWGVQSARTATASGSIATTGSRPVPRLSVASSGTGAAGAPLPIPVPFPVLMGGSAAAAPDSPSGSCSASTSLPGVGAPSVVLAVDALTAPAAGGGGGGPCSSRCSSGR